MTTPHPSSDGDSLALVLHDRLEREVSTVVVPVARLRSGAVERGRRVRRRRRLAGAGGGLAAAALAGLAVVALTVGSHGGGPTAVDPAAAPSAGTSASPLPKTRVGQAQDGERFPGALGMADVPARAVLRTLRSVLPAGTSPSSVQLYSPDPAPGESGDRRGNVVITLERLAASQEGGVEVRLHPAPATPLPADDPGLLGATRCPADDLEGATRCERLLDPTSGAVVGRATETQGSGFVVRTVLRQTAVGGWIEIATANSTDDKWGPGYAALPGDAPLSLDELVAMAGSSAWDELTASSTSG